MDSPYDHFPTAEELDPPTFPPRSSPAPILDELMALRSVGIERIDIDAKGLDLIGSPASKAPLDRIVDTLLAKRRNLGPLVRLFNGTDFSTPAWASNPGKVPCALCNGPRLAPKTPWGKYSAHWLCVTRAISPAWSEKDVYRCPRCHGGNWSMFRPYKSIRLCSPCRDWSRNV